ncbi:hypothetical protein LIER_15627 [Lithospermum erythrorhizon]|uniref:Uncharacterized protein n=1 Tax=Lithospermum erythrorhizon TaxID=34254 RepID=A0AAV3Q410_LITER
MQKENKEAQEQCIQEAEKLDLLDTRYTRLEAKNEGLNNKYKNAQLMAAFSKKKADEATQRADEASRKLKEVDEAIPGRIPEAIRYNEDWFVNCNLEAPLTLEEQDEEEVILPCTDQDDAQTS